MLNLSKAENTAPRQECLDERQINNCAPRVLYVCLQVFHEGVSDARYRRRPQYRHQRPDGEVQLGQGKRRSKQRPTNWTGEYTSLFFFLFLVLLYLFTFRNIFYFFFSLVFRRRFSFNLKLSKTKFFFNFEICLQDDQTFKLCAKLKEIFFSDESSFINFPKCDFVILYLD